MSTPGASDDPNTQRLKTELDLVSNVLWLKGKVPEDKLWRAAENAAKEVLGDTSQLATMGEETAVAFRRRMIQQIAVVLVDDIKGVYEALSKKEIVFDQSKTDATRNGIASQLTPRNHGRWSGWDPAAWIFPHLDATATRAEILYSLAVLITLMPGQDEGRARFYRDLGGGFDGLRL